MQFLLSWYCMPQHVLTAWDSAVKKKMNKNSHPHGVYVLELGGMGGKDSNQQVQKFILVPNFLVRPALKNLSKQEFWYVLPLSFS